jgi:hypothetical protein
MRKKILPKRKDNLRKMGERGKKKGEGREWKRVIKKRREKKEKEMKKAL